MEQLLLIHVLCVVHLLSVVDTWLHGMDGDLIRMVGFVVAIDMAGVAGAQLAGVLLRLMWLMWGLMHLR